MLPAHPSEGNFSMIRYWQIANEHLVGKDTDLEVSSFLPVEEAKFQPAAPRLKRAMERYWFFPRKVASADLGDAVHLLDHSSAHLLTSIKSTTKIIATVHDLIPLHFAQGLTNSQVERFRRTVMNLERADVILADSIATKDDVVNLLGIGAERVVVSPLGVSQNFNVSIDTSDGEGPDLPTVLSVGSALKRKNLEILPEVLSALTARVGKVRLVRVGDQLDMGLASELRSISNLELLEEGRASDERLAQLYSECTAVFIPSLYEGFGLPVLEGMAAGAAVVCSNTTSLPEVGGDVALYFDPNDPEEAAEQLIRLCEDPTLREDLAKRGRGRASKFTWAKHFDHVREIYRDQLS